MIGTFWDMVDNQFWLTRLDPSRYLDFAHGFIAGIIADPEGNLPYEIKDRSAYRSGFEAAQEQHGDWNWHEQHRRFESRWEVFYGLGFAKSWRPFACGFGDGLLDLPRLLPDDMSYVVGYVWGMSQGLGKFEQEDVGRPPLPDF